jgi:hypothetical protein
MMRVFRGILALVQAKTAVCSDVLGLHKTEIICTKIDLSNTKMTYSDSA